MMRQTRSVLHVSTACYSVAKAVDESRLGQRQPLRRLDLVERELRHRLSDLLGELAAAPFRSTATRNTARAQPSHEVK